MREERKKMTKLITLCICVHAQSFSCVTLCNPIDCSPLDSAVHGLLQAKIVEWVAISSSRGSSWPRDQTHVSCTGRHILYHWATWKSSHYAYKYGRILFMICISHFSCSVVSDSLLPHEPQHARPPCPSPTPGVHPNPCPLSRWCHPTISSSAVPFSSCPQSFPASGSFQMIQLFTWGGQSTGVSASKSVLPMNTQDWPPLGWTGWTSLQSKGLSRVFSNTTVQKHNSLVLSFLYSPTLTSIHDHWKSHSLD